MATRNQRRRRAKVKAIAFIAAAKAHAVGEIVKANKSRPIERNYFAGTISSVYRGEFSARARGLGTSHRLYR